jgi:pyridoxamine 5'-phosphate oxidase
MKEDIASLRREYSSRELRRSNVAADPIVQFRGWFSEALGAGLPEPNAMTLATVDATGKPSARIVLLKGFDDRGFGFFTNLKSRKALQIEASSFAALVFLWKEIERQVRIEGTVESVTDEESDAYFAVRPRGSQLGAWASDQSAPLASRDELERRAAEVEREFEGVAVPRPPHWGGLRVVPDRIEFWQGRRSRLHDRVLYTLESDGSWSISRLFP